jgi:hypothetical protein
MAFASATTALGGEVAHDVLLGETLSLALHRDLLRNAEEDLALHVVRDLGLPRQEEADRTSLVPDEEDVLGAEHLAHTIAELLGRPDAHAITVSLESRAQDRLHRQRGGTKTESFAVPNFRDGYKKGYKIGVVAPVL